MAKLFYQLTKFINMKNQILFLFIFFSFSLNAQSVLSPYSFKEKAAMEAAGQQFIGTGGEGYGFFPFLGENELKTFYDSSAVFNTIDKVSFFNLLNTEGDNLTSFVEVLSYVDSKSKFKANLSVQLTDTEQSDTSNTAQNVAIQKLLTSGGNIAIGINRPIYYNEFWNGNFFLVDAGLNAYFDLPYVNRRVYNPGVGSQFRIAGDFRILTDSENKGKFFRLGTEYSFVQNLFNSSYETNTDIPEIPSSIGFITFEPYIGLFFIDLKYSFIFSNNSIFNDKKRFVEVSIVPLKF